MMASVLKKSSLFYILYQLKMVRAILFISAVLAMAAFVTAVPGDAALLQKVDISDINVISPNNLIGSDKIIKSGNGNAHVSHEN
ncbi:hypothetical protein A0J61_08209 [Choanephora cucurbitarum]|uniref:Uncharacterized protein n=1 Tax=Choanephora cucurbitarum TaxID=101091 RepID=A0A1C7N3Q3_9FUNG|nr:hypothetical protein A0J61_08209 [Choanephora cucurbitarum]